jgi:CBS domain-containing protein
MRVSGLLDVKGDGVVTTGPDTSVAYAASLLADHGIGAVVVSTNGSDLVGVVSERDIVKALAARGAAALGETVAHIMTREVVTCQLGTTVEQLMTKMTERRVRHVPVIDREVLVGIVSIGDAVRDRISDLESETQVLHDYIAHGR